MSLTPVELGVGIALLGFPLTAIFGMMFAREATSEREFSDNPVNRVKQRYVDGEIGEMELEQRLESKLREIEG